MYKTDVFLIINIQFKKKTKNAIINDGCQKKNYNLG